MGHRKSAVCKCCGNSFEVEHGGGFFFHLLRCDKCGQTKYLGFDKLGELHLRYLKGLGGPYCIATWEQDQFVRDNYEGEPISEEDYFAEVEKCCPTCACGGSYRFESKPRCPQCKSEEITEGETTMFYD